MYIVFYGLFREKRVFFRTVCFSRAEVCCTLFRKKYKLCILRLYTEVLLLDRAMTTTHFNPSTITTNAVDRNVLILLAVRVASIRLRIQHHTYSTISVCPPTMSFLPLYALSIALEWTL